MEANTLDDLVEAALQANRALLLHPKLVNDEHFKGVLIHAINTITVRRIYYTKKLKPEAL